MLTFTTVAAAAALILVIVFGAAVIELFKDVKQLRDFVDLTDTPRSLRIPSLGQNAQTILLTRGMDLEPWGQALFLSTRCGTCRDITGQLQSFDLSHTSIFIEGASDQDSKEFLGRYEIPDDIVLYIDNEQSVAGQLGLETTPALVQFSNGIVSRADTVPSARALRQLLSRANDPTRAASAEHELSIGKRDSSIRKVQHDNHPA